MPLDPIVSLSVAIAEAPGSYALFLGSGVSRDAGVPTGSEVFWQAVGELYRLEETTDQTPDEAELGEWLAATERAELVYSDVLELIAPDKATRRDYLAKHFEGVEPGPAHEAIADLAASGYVKVFVTTNFDRLLERALQGRGLEPVVITSDADVAVAPPREHSRVYVLKPHGDYLQQTIRNTPAELAALEPAVAAAFKEILDRYGVVVIGYSGADDAIVSAMRARSSRYGFYWVARSELNEPAKSLVETVGGRLIVRPDAAAFFADLERRLAVFASQPSGLTPLAVHDEVVLLLRRGDRVGLAELLRRERREFGSRVLGVIDGRENERPTEDIAFECHERLMPAFERRLASLLPTILYAETQFGEEVASLRELSDRKKVTDGYVFWPDVVTWTLWWLGYAIGAFIVREDRFAVLKPFLEERVSERYGRGSQPLVQTIPGEAGALIGKSVMRRLDNQNWASAPWEALTRDLESLELLRERYPELIGPGDEIRRNLVAFDFILNASNALSDDPALAHWTLYPRHAADVAYRLHTDSKLRTRLAEAFGLTLAEFDERAPAALHSAHFLGSFPNRDAIRILETGSR